MMSEYNPDRWVMLKFTNEENGTVVYKILAGWSGSYLHGASWKLNSGVTKIEEDGQCYLFHGSSGSVYRCHKNSYGVTMYTAGILESFYRDIEEAKLKIKLECLDEDKTNFMELYYE